MDYPLENLDPERIQEVAHDLIKEHPNTQCFPIGQPDGGRDAVSYVPEPNGGDPRSLGHVYGSNDLRATVFTKALKP
jgi:hypothetical protein